MSVTVTVTETDEVIVTTSTLALAQASHVQVTPPAGSDITALNVQDAIHQLADQKFTGITAPTAADAHLDEGDLWYDTTNNLLKVYRNTTWEDLVIAAQLAEESLPAVAGEYLDLNLNGGYF